VRKEAPRSGHGVIACAVIFTSIASLASIAFVAGACSSEDTPDSGGDAGTADASRPDATSTGEDAGDPGDAARSDAADDASAADTGTLDAEPPDLGPLPVTVNTASTTAPRLLSDFHFFSYRDGVIDYNDGMLPYDLNTALFADYALKARAIYVPPGTHMTFAPQDIFELPVGSAIVKSFLFAADYRAPDRDVRIIETRVLVHYPDRWRAFPYLWRSDFSDADYLARGATVAVSLIDPFGNARNSSYLIPQRNQCGVCHDPEQRGPGLVPLGPKARYLHKDGQLENFAALGVLDGLPDPATIDRAFSFAPFATTGTTGLSYAEIEQATREYLDVNCAHCHRPGTVTGISYNLFLNVENTTLFNLGVCKEPGSAGPGSGGNRYDIVPGDPEHSILHYRVTTEIPGHMMPQLGRSLRDERGAAFVRAWIAGMTPPGCN
jgi:uncharacterized repeat protein (TIGR03806 family)